MRLCPFAIATAIMFATPLAAVAETSNEALPKDPLLRLVHECSINLSALPQGLAVGDIQSYCMCSSLQNVLIPATTPDLAIRQEKSSHVRTECVNGLKKAASKAPNAPATAATSSAGSIHVDFDAEVLAQKTKSIADASILPRDEVIGVFSRCVEDLMKVAPTSGNLYLVRSCSCAVDPVEFNTTNRNLDISDIKKNFHERENRCSAKALDDFKSNEDLMRKIREVTVSICKNNQVIKDKLNTDVDKGCTCVFNDVYAKHPDALVRAFVLQNLNGILPALGEATVACRKPSEYPFSGTWVPSSTGCAGLDATDHDDSIKVSGNKLKNETGVCTLKSISNVGNLYSTVENCQSLNEKHIAKRKILLSDVNHLILDFGTKFRSGYVRCR